MRIELPESRGDRLFMALVCPIFAGFLGLTLIGVYYLWEPDGVLQWVIKSLAR